jgi:hypothetical protein
MTSRVHSWNLRLQSDTNIRSYDMVVLVIQNSVRHIAV